MKKKKDASGRKKDLIPIEKRVNLAEVLDFRARRSRSNKIKVPFIIYKKRNKEIQNIQCPGSLCVYTKGFKELQYIGDALGWTRQKPYGE